MNAVATDLRHAVEDAASHLYVWALKDIPQDVRDALHAARERETLASASVIRVVSRYTAGRPSGVSTPRPASTSSTIACDTTSRGPSESVNSSPSAFRSTAPYARVVSGIE